MKTSKKLTIMGLSAATALVAATGAVSSFAWFAVNSSVTATGMVIKADSTNAFLEIKNGDGGSWPQTGSQTTAAFAGGTKTLSPTYLAKKADGDTIAKDQLTAYTDKETSHTWVNAVSDDADKAVSGIESYSVVTTDADAGTKYTLLASFDLRLRYTEANATKKYNLSAAISWNTETSNLALANAARVFMVVGTSNDESIKPQECPGYLFNERESKGWNAQGSTANKITILSGFTSDAGKKGRRVSLYYYFDGQDEACTTKNAEANKEYSITATFNVTEQA